MSEELRSLVKRCLRGEESAFGDLVNRYRQRVMQFCNRLLGQREDAEDAAQETFFRLAKHLHQWDESRAFEPWLLAIAGNRCRTAMAARRRRAVAQPFVDQPTNDDARDQEFRQMVEELELAVARLRPNYRQAFVMFHQRHLEYQEIARRLGVPMGTVKTWVHRARREISDFLVQQEEAQALRARARREGRDVSSAAGPEAAASSPVLRGTRKLDSQDNSRPTGA